MDSLWHDLRYSIRMLRHSPGFSAIAILTLALGIGATTAMFSVVNQALLQPLPYRDADRLVHVDWVANHGKGEAGSINARQALYLQQNSHAFASFAMKFAAPGCNLVTGGTSEYVDQAAVSADFFRTFEAEPVLGRSFAVSDAVGQPAQVAIVSYGLWRGKLGGNPNIVGSTIQCNGLPYTVIGVLPQSFTFPEEPADVWIPDRIENYLKDIGSNYWVTGRMRDGVSLAAAQQELIALAPRFHQDFPREAWNKWMGEDGHWNLVRLQDWRLGDQKASLLLLFGAVSLVLLIAAANVAGLILTRATGRTRELATRLALGATRYRLVRQLLTETVMLSVIGGIASLLLAVWTVGLLAPMVPALDISFGQYAAASTRGFAGRVDANMLLFAFVISLFAGVLAGIIPALRATRTEPYLALKQGDRSSLSGGQNRLRKVLVASEVALALLLLVGSTLLVRSFIAERGVAAGMDPRGVTVAYMSLGSARYQKTAAVANLQREVLARLRALPGVESSATVTAMPGKRDLNLSARMGQCEGAGSIQYRGISPSYFATVGLPLLRGRVFRENETQPVAVVNEAFAKHHCWAGKDALGAQFVIGEGMGDVPRQVVGIVADTHDYGPTEPATETVYVPQWQVPDKVTAYTNANFEWSVAVKSANVAGLGEAITRAVHQADPEQAVIAIVPLSEIMGNWLKWSRSIMQLMTAFAGLALVLTAIGLYGVLSYYVAQKTREIGIRMALGATQRHVLGRVFAEGLVVAGVGTAVGVAASFAATRLLKSFLFEVRANDPLAVLTSTVFLLMVVLIASFVPAWRATRVDPMIALRYE